MSQFSSTNTPKLALQLQTTQRIELSLSFAIERPEDLAWDEPDGHTPLRRDAIGTYYPIRFDDLAAYAAAARRTAFLVQRIRPHALVVSLRGAHPFGRAVLHALRNDGSILKLGRSAERTEWHVAPPAFRMPSSYFLRDIEDSVGRTIECVLRAHTSRHDRAREGLRRDPGGTGRGGPDVRIMLIETSVTGRKLGWFLPQFAEGLDRAALELRRPIHLDVVVLRPEYGGRVRAPALEWGASRVHEVLVPNLITEDVPALLGVAMRRSWEIHPMAKGRVRAHEPKPRADVRVVGGEQTLVFPVHHYRTSFRAFMAAFATVYRYTCGGRAGPNSVRVLRDSPDSGAHRQLERRMRLARAKARAVFLRVRHRDPAAARTACAVLRGIAAGFDAVNRAMAGATEARAAIIKALEIFTSDVDVALSVIGVNPASVRNVVGSFDVARVVQSRVAVAVVAGMYDGRGRDAAHARGVALEHRALDRLASHACVQAVSPRYDLALIVGPEGFAYEPMFHDAGLPTVAVNVPESEPSGPRSLQTLPGEDLYALAGKRVLVVEDDVRSGATLRTVLRALPGAPTRIDLFLGSPVSWQKLDNVPPELIRVHTVIPESDEYGTKFLSFLRGRGIEPFLWPLAGTPAHA